MKEYTKIKTAQTIICDMCNELHPDEPCRQSACEWMPLPDPPKGQKVGCSK